MSRAWSSSRLSFAGVAMRTIARTFEYDTSPRRSASSIVGNSASLPATRTRSRAVTRSQPTRQASQCAHDRAPWTCQPPRSSNSRRSVRRRCIAASTCAACSAIRSPSCSSSTVMSEWISRRSDIATFESTRRGRKRTARPRLIAAASQALLDGQCDHSESRSRVHGSAGLFRCLAPSRAFCPDGGPRRDGRQRGQRGARRGDNLIAGLSHPMRGRTDPQLQTAASRHSGREAAAAGRVDRVTTM